jgi:2,4-dienoyl-CoA reductase (NADPH2)
MEAARVAALRGHKVTLLEKSHKLGGTIPVAALVKGLEIENLPTLVSYLGGQVEKLGVEIKTGHELDLQDIERMKPDAVVIAAGGIPATPPIKGIDGHNVIKSGDLHGQLKFYLRFFSPGVLRWLTKFYMPVGRNVVILGGQIAACQLAEFLVKRGRTVTIVEEGDTLGTGLIPERKMRLFSWFRKKGVTLMANTTCTEITSTGVTVTTQEGGRVTLKADSVIPALPMLSNTELAEKLKGKVPEIYMIGDCKGPGLISDATADGWKIGNAL